ncbi:aspartate aminotransferase family protein [Alkaliphilus serpentinus]|uniref:aspartate aminotransferase family protein n=1 Tax=Alkaliphilus serpentinus TaxID=1482731 RepID=UPI001A9BAB07|nr:aspartate aminotransferase family protein [Alkaliphilus serpentinus]
MKTKTKLRTLKDLDSIDHREIEELYRNYINPYFVNLLRLLGLNKRFVRAEGNKVWDSSGREYLDFLGAYGAINLGHNHKKVIEKIIEVQERPNLLQTVTNPLAALLAENLAAITPGDLQYSFFCNSGAEAVEGAIKLAKISTGKPRIIYCKGSFHGKSMGALSITGREKYRKYFNPLMPATTEVAFGSKEELKDVFNLYDDIAAFIVEPIQGEGGIITPPEGYLKEVRRLCSEKGILLIVDEIQTGFGRTGHWFACDEEGINPDILCMAKSLGGGIMPIGAYIASKKVWHKGYGSIDRFLLHTSTFGGNTWACAAALAAIETLNDDNLIAETAHKGKYFIKRLKALMGKHPILVDVRGKGLMIGLEFDEGLNSITRSIIKNHTETVREYIGGMIASSLVNQHGIITAYTLNNPKVIRIEPPLTVTYQEIDYFINALDLVMVNLSGLKSLAFQTAKNLLGSFKKGREA